MKVVAFTSDKGGMGKSTAALNLACAAAEDRYEAALLDLDPQASIGRWARLRRKAGLPPRPLAETCVPIDVEDRLAELRAVGANLRVRGWLWWRRIALPVVFPYYVTGAITASGGSWNASIVAEVASWGNQKLEAIGLGAYIAQKTDEGDFHHIVLGIAVMSLYVVVVNRLFWRPLYLFAERKFRLG